MKKKPSIRVFKIIMLYWMVISIFPEFINIFIIGKTSYVESNIDFPQIASANWTPRMNKICSASAGLAFHTASTAGAVKDAEGKAQPIP